MDCAWEAYGRSRLLPVRLRRRMQRTQRIISTQVSADEKTPDEANVLQHFSEMFSTRIRTPNGQRALEREDMALASRYPVSRSTMYGGWHASTSLQHRLPPAARLWGDATRAPGLVVLVLSRGGSPAGHFEHLR